MESFEPSSCESRQERVQVDSCSKPVLEASATVVLTTSQWTCPTPPLFPEAPPKGLVGSTHLTFP